MRYFVTLILIVLYSTATAQTDSAKKWAKLPTNQLISLNNKPAKLATYFKQGRPTILIFFNPECDHCQDEIKNIVNNYQQTKNIQFVLMSNRPLANLSAFKKEYKLTPNMVVLQDTNNELVRHYEAYGFPSMIIYNKNKQLTKRYISSIVSIKEMLLNAGS